MIFLSEAFTRPAVMHRLAKLGFTQSYTYFTWRNPQAGAGRVLHRADADRRSREYFRPNLWPNTPDILTEQLQTGGRPAFARRLCSAATLGAELRHLRPGVRADGARAARARAARSTCTPRSTRSATGTSTVAALAREAHRAGSTGSAREHPALQHDRTLRFHPTENDAAARVLARQPGPTGRESVGDREPRPGGTASAGCVASVGSRSSASPGTTPLPGARPARPASVTLWQGVVGTYVELDPDKLPAHVLRVRPHVRDERDFATYRLTMAERRRLADCAAARSASRPIALVQGRRHLRGPRPRLRRPRRRRHRRLPRADRRSSTTCRTSASPRIWLLPFYPSPLQGRRLRHRRLHATSIPRTGRCATSRRSSREAHRRGLRVITELVLNHTSDQHPWFQRARRAPAGHRRARLLRLERHAREVPGRPDHLQGLRAVELDLGPGGQGVLLAPLLLATSRT